MLKNKKMAVVFTADIVGGHELMAIEHIKKYLKKKVDVSCYVPENNEKLISIFSSNSINFERHSVKHKRMEIIHSFFNLSVLWKSVSFLRKIRSAHDEIIIVQGDIELGAGFINAAKLTKTTVTSYIPYSHTFKQMGSKGAWLKDFLSAFVYGNCRRYITICETFKSELEIKSPGATVNIIRNFVPLPAVEEIRGIGYVHQSYKNKIRILMAGRVYFRQKGQDKLLQAVSEIGMNIDILVIGDGPDLDKLKMMAQLLPHNITVDFIGWKNNVWDYAYNIDLVVMPSNYEGVPLIMLEAIKRNVPIIAPARDGMIDYLSDEFLYATGDYHDECTSLKNKIIYFAEHQKQDLNTHAK